ELDVKTPDHAFAVQPCVVEPHLAMVVALQCFKVVDAEQHAKLSAQRGEWIGRAQRAAAVAGGDATRHVRSAGHACPLFSISLTRSKISTHGAEEPCVGGGRFVTRSGTLCTGVCL